MSDEHSDVLVPHTKRDYKRVALTIMAASIPLYVTAWQFLSVGTTEQDVHAAYVFAFGATLLLASGAGIAVKDWLRG